MQTLAPEIRSGTTTLAEQLANRYWEANRRALSRNQPVIAALLEEVTFDHEWVLARDGSVTALENGRWWAGCSVPVLAGRTHLKSLADEPVGSCQLAPCHAGLVSAARERMGHCPVLFVAQPDAGIARMILSCQDFSKQIENHRFWITTGPAWLSHFEQMFTDNPGLATPLRFIRTRLTPEEISSAMIVDIQAVFSRVLSCRSAEISRIKSEPVEVLDTKKILLVGGTEFHLWDFGTQVLKQQLNARAGKDELTIRAFDMDDALLGSPLALLSASRECGSVVAANVCRADCNQLVSPEIPWITWMTQPGAPPFETAGPRDALILADEKWRQIARVAGWPAERVRVCGWPGAVATGVPRGRAIYEKSLGLICDTRKISIPTSVADFSSHRLLWELIEEELAANPLVVEEVDAYLTNRAAQLNIAVDVLDRPKFVEELMYPAYQQGIARLLISARVSIRLWGKGWGDLPEFAARLGGSISNHTEFEEAIDKCIGLVYCWPTRAAHALETVGKPVLYRTAADRSTLIRAAKNIVNGIDRKPAGSSAMDDVASIILDSLT